MKPRADREPSGDLRTSLDLVLSHMAVVQSTQDSKEALSAFAEKRQPRSTER